MKSITAGDARIGTKFRTQQGWMICTHLHMCHWPKTRCIWRMIWLHMISVHIFVGEIMSSTGLKH